MTREPAVRRGRKAIGSRKSGWIRGRDDGGPATPGESRDSGLSDPAELSPPDRRRARKRRRPTRLRFAVGVAVLVLYVLILRAAEQRLFGQQDALFVLALMMCAINFAIFTHDRASVRWVGRMLFAVIPALFVFYVMGLGRGIAVWEAT